MNSPRPIPSAWRTDYANLTRRHNSPVKSAWIARHGLSLLSRLAGFGLLFVAALPAAAEWHGSLSFLSDYQYRGYTKSRSNPVAQGNLEYEHRTGWYAGATLSQVSFDDKPNRSRASFEARPYVGWGFMLADDWRSDLWVTGYLYDGDLFAKTGHYAEIYGSLTYRNWLTGRIALAPDAYQQAADIFNYELSARHDLNDNLQLSAGLGYHDAKKLLHTSYFYWNAGATWYPYRHLAVDIRYTDAQPAAPQGEAPFGPNEFYPRPIENNWLLSITLGF
ncbi:MAG: hypothetical protein FIA97_07780 [Methylococcaceae bacterium]|nr:hypothetical protein [Methylococcaceae bacterium]